MPALHHAQARQCIAVAMEAQRLYVTGGDGEVAGLALFDSVRPDMDAAIAWLQSRTDAESAGLLVALADAITHTSEHRFDPPQRVALFEAQVRAARITGDRLAECRALSNLGNVHYSMGDARKALECHEKAMQISGETGTRREDGLDWACMGMAYSALGDARLALMCYENQLATVQKSGDRHGEGKAWGSVGSTHARLGDAGRALECYGRQLTIMQETGDRRGEGIALANMGLSHTALGDAVRAIECHGKALIICEENGDRRGEGLAWSSLGNAHADLGHSRRAVECFEKRVTIARETGDVRGEGSALFNTATKLWELNAPGERDEALRRMAAAAEIFKGIGDPNAANARTVLAQWGASKSMPESRSNVTL